MHVSRMRHSHGDPFMRNSPFINRYLNLIHLLLLWKTYHVVYAFLFPGSLKGMVLMLLLV